MFKFSLITNAIHSSMAIDKYQIVSGIKVSVIRYDIFFS